MTNLENWRQQNELVTDGIRVSVAVMFVPERSVPHTPVYFYAYRVTIANQSNTTAKLINRHWLITDGVGRQQKVDGAGVVGEQPTLKPGEAYTYSSFCPLPTEFGTMEGSYDMQHPDGSMFSVKIPLFALGRPEFAN